MSKKLFGHISYIAVVVFAAAFLLVGNKIAVADLPDLHYQYGSYETVEAKVTKILDLINTNLMFEAEIISGASHNSIMGIQNVNQNYLSGAKQVEPGDKVIVSRYWDSSWEFVDYVRIDKIMLLCGAFLLVLLIFGRIKGVNAILSLGVTCFAIFAVFLPALLSGKNIYLSAVIVCVFASIVTLFIVNGVNQKAIAAVAGCIGGIVSTGILTLVMNKALGVTGVLNKDSMLFLYLFKEQEHQVDLQAVIFAGILIGAVGAVMDVGISVASALQELKLNAPGLGFGGILRSGINIGQDIMGTMTNTLVLAYVGNSLSVVVLLAVYTSSFAEMLNRELVIVELLQAVIGSIGILLTMPLTALVCAFVYSGRALGDLAGRGVSADAGRFTGV